MTMKHGKSFSICRKKKQKSRKKQFKLLRSFKSFVLYYNENFDIKVKCLKKVEEEKADECENEANALELMVERWECDDDECVKQEIAKLKLRADFYRKIAVYFVYIFKCKNQKTFIKVLRIALRFKDKSVDWSFYHYLVPAVINGKERHKNIHKSLIWNFDVDKNEIYFI